MTDGSIFISYRRDDSIAHAGRLYDHLSRQFGADRVFMDVDAIEPGDDFVDVMQRKVGACTVLIAVIGTKWAGRTADGRTRLESPSDYVRLELAAALARKIRVIPALVGGAEMPPESSLPSDLAPLVRRNAIVIDDTAFHNSAERLVDVLQRSMGVAQVGDEPGARDSFLWRHRAAVAAILVAILGVGFVTVRWLLRSAPASFAPAQEAAAPQSTLPPSTEPTSPAPTASQPDASPAPLPRGGRTGVRRLAAPGMNRPRCGAVVTWPPPNGAFIIGWDRVPEASSYTVEVDCFGCGGVRKWFSEGGTPWHLRDGLGFRTPIYSSPLHKEMSRAGGIAFRWRVWAVDASSRPGLKSAWCHFSMAGTRPTDRSAVNPAP